MLCIITDRSVSVIPHRCAHTHTHTHQKKYLKNEMKICICKCMIILWFLVGRNRNVHLGQITSAVEESSHTNGVGLV